MAWIMNPGMRRLLTALTLFMAVSSVQAASGFESLSITQPKQRMLAPDFSLSAPNGDKLRLSDFRGQPVLLNFWASFCLPCRKEMPALQRLWNEYSDDGLVVLAVAADRGKPDPVTAFMESGDFRFPVLLDTNGEVRSQYEVQALPTTYLIGADGRFIGRMIGPRDWNSDGYRQLIRTLLAAGQTALKQPLPQDFPLRKTTGTQP